VIPLKKGVVNLVNYRAEGEMEKGCVLVDFSPACVDAVRSHKAYFNHLKIPYNPAFSDLYSNHYYVVVK
jgi:hypothetical protein